MSEDSRKLETKQRAYDNRLRRELASQTRERILDAVATLVWEGRLEDFSIKLAAEKSGVSAATIYRYFPNRTALLDAVDAWLGQKIQRPELPQSPDELVGSASALFEFYERNQREFSMSRATGAMRELRAKGRKERDRVLMERLSELTAHLDDERARAAVGLLRVIYSFDAYQTLRERFEVTSEVAGDTVGWAMGLLVEDLRASARERPAKRQKAKKKTAAGPRVRGKR